MQKLLTAAEAAALMRIAKATLCNKARDGKIPYVSEGKGSPMRFWARDILAHNEKHTHAAHPVALPLLRHKLNESVRRAMEGVR